MTRFLGLGLLMVALSAGAWAQSTGSTGSGTSGTATAPEGWHRGGERHGGFGGFGQLNLTEDQKTRLHTLMQNERQQIDAIRQDTTLTDAQKREKIGQIHKDMRTQFSSILTPEQQQQLAQGRRGHRGDPLSALNLTEQQKAAVKPIFESAHNSMRSVMQDTTLTPEQKHEKMKQIQEQTHSQLATILTPEQLQQLQHFGPRGFGRRGPGHGPGAGPQGGTNPQS